MGDICFDYYYGDQAEMFSFYRIPKKLFTDEHFKGISCEAKLLYGLMLDRMSLSVKNRWFDENGKVYIVFTVEEVMELMNCSKVKAVKCIAELDVEKGIGLIEKKRLGFGKANLIYVKNFMTMRLLDNFDKGDRGAGETGQETASAEACFDEKSKLDKTSIQKYIKCTSRSLKNILPEVQKLNFSGYENYTSGSTNNVPLEVKKVYCNNTDINYTEKTNTESYPSIVPKEERSDRTSERCQCEQLVKQHIEYDILCQEHSGRQVDEIVSLLVDTICTANKTVQVNRDTLPSDVVRSRFLKINYMHLKYVFLCLENNASKIHNIRGYLLTVLYNAPATMDCYYDAEVRHGLPGE